MAYRLMRRLPDGKLRQHSMPFDDMRGAAKAVFYVLIDNGAASKRDATAFASRLQDSAAGTELAHESGYAFMIVAD